MKIGNAKGQTLVEFALCLPLLVLIVFGITEFGRAIYVMNTLNYAAREGARRASVSPSPLDMATLRTQVGTSLPASFDQTGLNIVIDPPTPPNNAVRVVVTQPFRPVVGSRLLEKLHLGGLTLRGEAAMRYES